MSIPNPFGNSDPPLEGQREAFVEDNDISQRANAEAIGGVSLSNASLNGNWSNPGGNAENNPSNLSYSGGLNSVWSASVGNVSVKRGRASAMPIVHNGIAYVKDTKAQVTALSLSSGGLVWRASLKPEKEKSAVTGGGVAADGDLVFVATGYSEMAALSAQSGNLVWKVKLDEPARSAPTAANGVVAVITADNKAILLSQSDGSEIWSFRGLPEKSALARSGQPAIANGAVIAPFSSGELVAIEIKSGKVRWSDALVRSGKRFAISGLSDIAGSPVISGNSVYAGGVSGRFVSNDITSGSRRWTTTAMAIDTPVVSGNSVFFTDHQGIVIAVDNKSGTVRWATNLPKEKREKWGGPSLAGNKLYIGSSEGRIARVNAENGVIEFTSGRGSPLITKPIFVQGKMLILTDNGRLTLFQ